LVETTAQGLAPPRVRPTKDRLIIILGAPVRAVLAAAGVAAVAAKGDIYYALGYPVLMGAVTKVVGRVGLPNRGMANGMSERFKAPARRGYFSFTGRVLLRAGQSPLCRAP
jgi:hypothetical protein